ncbi:MAG: MBOAT family O-acyltransferase [Acidimicrobiales bacterium]
MLFPTIRFAIFFSLVLPISWLLMHRPQRWKPFAVAASFVFYASWDAHYLLLLGGSIVGNQMLATIIHRERGDRARNRWTLLAVALNLGVLGWYKYAGFFADSTANALSWVGIDWHVSVPNVLLPVGISFFTFQALSYVIDVRRRIITPVSFIDFAVYLSFFPHLVAGPIVRAREFLPQLRRRRDPRRVDASLAFWLIAAGLVKKVVIASYLAEQADALFSVPQRHGGFEALLGIYAYALQIYADFSGYTDMAIGMALLLGFRFPANFDAPYSATSLQDFWRRWHMTLSRWLRDYLYVPLGGSKGGRRRTYRNLMLTMLLGGLWHGAGWTFVAWGALHGGGLVVERWWSHRYTMVPFPEPELAATPGAAPSSSGRVALAADPRLAAEPRYAIAGATRGSPRVWLRRIVTFHIVCLGWVFFRATSFANAFAVLGRLSHPSSTAVHGWVIVTIVVMLCLQHVPAGTVARAQAAWSRWSLGAQGASLAAVLLVVDVLGPTGVSPFIYFQF